MAYTESPTVNYSTLGAAQAVKQTTILTVIEGFDPVIGRLAALAMRANNCGDKINGPRPTGVDADKPEQEPSGLINCAQARRERLVRIVDHLENEINRIESGLS